MNAEQPRIDGTALKRVSHTCMLNKAAKVDFKLIENDFCSIFWIFKENCYSGFTSKSKNFTFGYQKWESFGSFSIELCKKSLFRVDQPTMDWII
jgi:hypothetical protein